MDKESKTFFNKALESIEDSKIAIKNKRYNMSVNRSYYATFYGAKSLLIKKGIFTKTHSGTISAFGFEYVINDNFNKEIAKLFSKLEDYRENSDYDAYFVVEKEEAIANLENAETFIEECRKFL
ncbi:MAG: HEPN domain-containing protein [Methanobrevibacter sp. CfCl-M3]